MKYFLTLLSIVLFAVVLWATFFSGLIFKKSQPPPDVKSRDTKMSKNSLVVLETNFGPIKVALDKAAAPKTSENFEKLVSQKFYDGLTFHRIVPGFVIQGGDPKGDGTGGPGYTIPAEIKLLHKRGAVAMARLGDQVNPDRASSGSQFYIALADLPGLDGQYTVFGEVVLGMEIVDKIAIVKTDPATARPLEGVIIKRAYIESQ